MKRFLNKTHGNRGTGRHVTAGRKSLRAAVFFFCFLVQLSLFPVSAVCGTSAALSRPSAVTCRSSVEERISAVRTIKTVKVVRKITKGCVKLSKTSYKYDGHAKKPSVTVTYARKKLKKNRDYTVSYENNKKRGTAKVVVKGRGDYSGTVTRTFRIK